MIREESDRQQSEIHKEQEVLEVRFKKMLSTQIRMEKILKT